MDRKWKRCRKLGTMGERHVRKEKLGYRSVGRLKRGLAGIGCVLLLSGCAAHLPFSDPSSEPPAKPKEENGSSSAEIFSQPTVWTAPPATVEKTWYDARDPEYKELYPDRLMAQLLLGSPAVMAVRLCFSAWDPQGNAVRLRGYLETGAGEEQPSVLFHRTGRSDRMTVGFSLAPGQNVQTFAVQVVSWMDETGTEYSLR